jgi:NCAIR mutase (PurE)-related protein
MTANELQALLESVRSGAISPGDARDRVLQFVRHAPFEDLGFARVDHHRAVRQGFPEVVFGERKTPDQIASIAEHIAARGHTLLVTRTSSDAYAAVRERISGAVFHETARLIAFKQGDVPEGRGTIMVAAAGTSDIPVAEEAAISAELMGNCVDRLYDVGVAGIHRLLSETNRLQTARVVIAVAGMEGAMPSVIGGLVAAPVIAVPTSVGYGASFGGITALLGMLNTCATGVAVVNIDNGFGAAAMASAITHLA